MQGHDALAVTTHNELGPHQAAINAFITAVKHCPDDADLRCHYGNLLSEQNKTAAAVLEYSTAIKLSPLHGLAFSNRAATIMNQGDFAVAIDPVWSC